MESSLVRALGCALDLHEAAVAGADDVHVGLGLDVFLVGEVEQEHATNDADAARGDRAGERLGLGPDGLPHDRSVAADAPAALKAIDKMGQPRIAVVSRVNWRWPISL